MIYEIDPLQDSRWPEFLSRHPRASVFHSRAWLEALWLTYEYQPVVLTTSAPNEELRNGLVVCRVRSWLTGNRMVSLPFSDHCEPLADRHEELPSILGILHDEWKGARWKHIEIRPAEVDLSFFPDLTKSQSFCSHRLDLHSSSEELFRGFHDTCVRRKIRRAAREHLTCVEGRSESLLERFYHLLVETRRRHLLPPPPLAWFRNLIACMGDDLKIRVASKDGRPVASILTLSHKATLIYKYGCSDRRFNHLGGTQLVFWQAIQEAKSRGLCELDLGRSNWDDVGLINFKDRWGATRSTLTYWRYGNFAADLGRESWSMRTAGWLFGHMPTGLLTAIGKLLYRHVG